jgi:predicted metal-dependent hydrolase
VPIIAKTCGFCYKDIAVNNAKTLWGRCDNAGRISFNLRAVMLAPRLIDYLIIHELAHTKELNHSQKFWDTVAAVLPDYKVLRAELKQKAFIQELFR